MNERCGLCLRDPALGYATVGESRFCHGDWQPSPTCYEQVQRTLASGSAVADGATGEVLLP